MRLFQAAIGYYILEGLLLVTYRGLPLKPAAEGLLGKVGQNHIPSSNWDAAESFVCCTGTHP